LISKKAIGIKIGEFSFAEVPLEFEIILGVTGTLETMSNPQNEIKTKLYKINH
jgi:hypothetical protein